MKLWHKVTLGLILGVLFGLLVKEKAIYLKPIGDIFINMIRMVIVPLIFFSLISGITSIKEPASLGRMGMRASLFYLITTTFAILIGIIFAKLFKPGFGVDLNLAGKAGDAIYSKIPEEFSFLNMIVNIVPHNAFAAMAEGNILQIVFFAIFTGFTLMQMGEQGKELIKLSQLMAKFVFKMISIIIKLSPYGAFASTSWIVGSQGVDVLFALFNLIGTILVGMTTQYFLFGILIYIFAKLSPLPFYKKSFEYQALALSTSSSKATLATTMKVCRERLGVSETSTSFILPLGAAMNMDGMAIYLGITAVFFAQATGIELHNNDYIIIILTATLGSIGGAGIPGASVIMLPMILAAIHIPIEGIALIAGIDRIIDMIRTMINITGDATVTVIIDKVEGKLDEKIYYSK